jgi:hypothetical protein
MSVTQTFASPSLFGRVPLFILPRCKTRLDVFGVVLFADGDQIAIGSRSNHESAVSLQLTAQNRFFLRRKDWIGALFRVHRRSEWSLTQPCASTEV